MAVEAETTTYGGAPPQAVRSHYDLSNHFYATRLDESMTYSCALWDEDAERDTLADAQRRKLDYLATVAHAPGGGRALEVGCGWGSILRRLAHECGVERAVGLTLSSAQVAHVASRADGSIEA